MSSLMVTTSWDDGCPDDLRVAKLLDKYGIRGTFYVAKEYRNPSLCRGDLKMLDMMHEVGAHTLTHADLVKIPLAEAEKEVRDGKSYLEEILGHSLAMFAYPKGHYNKDIKQLVMNCGFTGARAVFYDGFNYPRDRFAWGVTTLTSNKSPLFSLKVWLSSGISLRSLWDWELRAKQLFDLALIKGGIYHIFGHSWAIERDQEWDKLERLLQYIGQKEGVRYCTNAQCLAR